MQVRDQRQIGNVIFFKKVDEFPKITAIADHCVVRKTPFYNKIIIEIVNMVIYLQQKPLYDENIYLLEKLLAIS